MIKRFSILIFLILLAISGCAPSAMESPAMVAPGAPSGGNTPQDSFAGERAVSDSGSDFAVSNVQPADEQRIVIRNASLTIIVDDPGQSLDTISRMAENMGGFVVTSDLHKTYTENGAEVPEASVTVRVPADKLNEAMAQIKKLVKDPANDISSENVSGQDVTKEYTDLNSQLKNLEEAEAQLREIMASATKTEDVLAIFQQLTQVRQQIEVIKGQIQYYKESATMSAITIQIRAQASVQPLEVGGWKPVGVARDALQALINTLQFLGSATIWILIFILPVGLAIFIPLRILWWLIRRGRKNHQKPQAMTVPPTTPPATGA